MDTTRINHAHHGSFSLLLFSDIENGKENSSNMANLATTAQFETPSTSDDKSTILKEMLDILEQNPNSTKEISVTFNYKLKDGKNE